MRRLLCLLLLLAGACADDKHGQSLRVATYNLYLGADLAPLLAPTLTAEQAPAAVTALFAAVQASDPPARMDAIAAQLATASPDIIMVEEAALWRTQATADGPATPATDVAYDFLQLLVDALGRRTLTYVPVVVGTHADLEAPSTQGDVRFTDRDVLLVNANAGLPIGATDSGTFTAELSVPTMSFGTVQVPRGWVSLETQFRGLGMRIVGTHLEAYAAPVRDAQAGELLTGPAAPTSAVVLGDFNFGPNDAPYGAFTAAQLVDAWPRANPGDAGPTCCQDANLRNETSKLDQRIDLVWTRGPLDAAGAARLGATVADRTPSGLWPSDHAGVSVALTTPQ